MFLLYPSASVRPLATHLLLVILMVGLVAGCTLLEDNGTHLAYALEKGVSRLDYLDGYLNGREFLLDHFSVADAYLITVINWTMATPPIDLAKWPHIKAYYERTRARPSIARALAEEFSLYKAELARHKAAA